MGGWLVVELKREKDRETTCIVVNTPGGALVSAAGQVVVC